MARRTEAEIMSAWSKNKPAPLVTVMAICYCHEKYLRCALDSILAQETDFAFDIVVHDDASTDNSAAIIREYAESYPNLIHPVLEEVNQYSKGIRNLLQAVKPYFRGKYFAYLECDDYWTDVHKLQEQVDYLEKHPGYVAVAHKCTVIDEEGAPCDMRYPECMDEEYTIAHYIDDILPGQAGTLLVRDVFSQAYSDYHLIMNPPSGPFDRAFILTMLYTGRIHCIQKSMSAYRYVTDGGTSYSATYKYNLRAEARFHFSIALYCKRMGRSSDAIGLLHRLEKIIGSASNEESEAVLSVCRNSINTLADQLLGEYKRCPCCGELVRYKPMTIEQQEKILAIEGLFLPETLNVDSYLCPNCSSTDKERLMVQALEHMSLSEKDRDFRILHIAPSHALDTWIRENYPRVAYETCDFSREALDSHTVVQSMPDVPEKSYDLILWSNVLEQVRDDRKYLMEIKRILKKGGSILCHIPVDLGFSGIDEEWGLSEEENLRRFGHANSCRRYSRKGLIERLQEHFYVRPLGIAFFGEACFYQSGLTDSSILYELAKSDETELVFDGCERISAPYDAFEAYSGRIAQMKAEQERLQNELDAVRHDYDVISNAAFWQMTKPARMVLDAIKKWFHQKC